MGAILKYSLFCCLVVGAVITGIAAGLPVNIVATLGIWTASLGAIVTVIYRFLNRER